MKRYQLRMKAGHSLMEILDRMVASVWERLSLHPELVQLDPDRKSALKAGLGDVFGRFIVQLDVCGAEVGCDENLSPAEWNEHPDPELAPRHPWQADQVRRLTLDLEGDLEDFVKALEVEIFKDLSLAGDPAGSPLTKDMSEAIRESVGPFLYRSVACGLFDLCRQAERSDPWR